VTGRFVEKDGANGRYEATNNNVGTWSSPVNQIFKLPARNLTLKLQMHSIFLRQLCGTQIAKASVS
jgi:hypothetical protein